MTAFNSVAVIGAGAWGTALACISARAGRKVILYARDAAHAARITSTRENPRLPGVRLAADIAVTNDIAEAACADTPETPPFTRASPPVGDGREVRRLDMPRGCTIRLTSKSSFTRG